MGALRTVCPPSAGLSNLWGFGIGFPEVYTDPDGHSEPRAGCALSPAELPMIVHCHPRTPEPPHTMLASRNWWVMSVTSFTSCA